MAKKKNFTVEDLWRIERLGNPSLAPDGAQAVAALDDFTRQDSSTIEQPTIGWFAITWNCRIAAS